MPFVNLKLRWLSSNSPRSNQALGLERAADTAYQGHPDAGADHEDQDRALRRRPRLADREAPRRDALVGREPI